MQTVREIRNATAFLLLSLLPGHQRVDTPKVNDSTSNNAILSTSNLNSEQRRNKASSLSFKQDGFSLKQKKSLDKVIERLSKGKEPSYKELFNLLNNFTSYSPNDFYKFLVQLQKDIKNPESELFKNLNLQTRTLITKQLNEYLEILNRRQGEFGRVVINCDDLFRLSECNKELKPEEKLLILKTFSEQFSGDNSLPSRESFFLAKTRSNTN